MQLKKVSSSVPTMTVSTLSAGPGSEGTGGEGYCERVQRDRGGLPHGVTTTSAALTR